MILNTSNLPLSQRIGKDLQNNHKLLQFFNTSTIKQLLPVFYEVMIQFGTMI